MRRDWNKYLNTQKYSECQLVTAINAYYFLTGKTINQDSDEYEELVDLCGARYGSALKIERVHKRLGIKVVWSNQYLYENYQKKIPLPLEFNCWHKRVGFHSTLIVDHIVKIDALRVTNFKYATSTKGWMFREDLYQFELVQKKMRKKMFRLFEIVKSENY